MDQTDNQIKPPKRISPRTSTALSVSVDLHRKIKKLLTKANKKEFGSRISMTAVLEVAISLVEDSHIRQLQEQSMTNAERLEQQRQEHAKNHGAISRGDFVALLLSLHRSHLGTAKHDVDTASSDAALDL